MGHSDDCISFSKTRVAATQNSNLTLPVRNPSPPSQSIPPLLVSGSPSRQNATDFPQDISAVHIYSQSRDAIPYSAVTGDSSVHNFTGVSSPVQIPAQAPTYPPTTVAPSYTATAQSYGDVRYASGFSHRVRRRVQISGGMPNRNPAVDNHVLSPQQYKVFQAHTYPPKTVAPSYTATAQSYGDDRYASEFSDRVSRPVQISGDINPAFDDPVLSEQQCFQAPTYPPTTVAPSYNTTARYGGDARYASGMGGTDSPSSSSACSFHDSYSGLDVDLPTQVSDGISGRYVMVDSVASLQGITFQTSSSSIAFVPSYGSHSAQDYTDDTSHVPLPSNSTSRYSNSPVDSFTGHSTCGLAPQSPLPSVPTTPTSRSPHLNTHYQTPLAGRNYQTMAPREQGGQQPLAHTSRVFMIDGCWIEGVDLVDQASADGNITVGQCLRTDSPCSLWVKADKGSLKRHLKRWHGVTRGGDSIKTSCTWQGCDVSMQKSAVPRHIIRKHFNETFKCNGCDGYFTRHECWKNHTPRCEFSGLGWTVWYGGGTRIINVLGMSLSQGG